MRSSTLIGLLSCSAGLSLLVSFILLFRSKRYNLQMLGVSFFSSACFSILVLLIYSQRMPLVPHLFRTAVPLMYVVAPASFLYIRATINGENSFRSRDLIHFLPFALLVLELTPFYLKSASYKLVAMGYYQNHQQDLLFIREGLFSEYFHFTLRILLAFYYAIVQWQLIAEFFSKSSEKEIQKYGNLMSWLKSLTLVSAINYMMLAFFPALAALAKFSTAGTSIFLSLQPLVGSLLLIFHPRVLYGMDQTMISVEPAEDTLVKSKEPLINMEALKTTVDKALRTKQLFLNQGLSIAHLIEETGISYHILNRVLKEGYDLSFNDLINKYRIEYIIQNFDKGQLRNYTLEGMAFEAGFSSRTTFYRAFKKIFGQTPTSYFKLKEER